MEIINHQAQKVVAVTYKSMFTSLFTRGSNCEALTRKLLVFWIGGCLWEVVAYERWSHIVVTKTRNDLQWSTMIYNDLQWPTMIYNDLQWPTMSYYDRTCNPCNELKWKFPVSIHYFTQATHELTTIILLACIVDGLFDKRAHLATLQLICTCTKQNHQLCRLPIQLL